MKNFPDDPKARETFQEYALKVISSKQSVLEMAHLPFEMKIEVIGH